MQGYKISRHIIKVDRSKIKVIGKLPPLVSVRGIESFLGHADFNKRFIKEFSKISTPLCKLLEKEVKFVFGEECLKAFKYLKDRLISTLTMVSSKWSAPFKVMFNESVEDLGVVLEQRKDMILHPIYYSIKAFNPIKKNYTVKE